MTKLPMMSWNVKAGGYDLGYGHNSSELLPSRGNAIQSVIASQRARGVRAALLTDVNRWDEVYGGEAGIASHMQFAQARFARLGDKRLEQGDGAGIGIAFVTDEKIAQSSVIDMGTRNALGVVLDVGRYGLQIAGVYLDDLDEDARLKQFRALDAQLELDVPTILTGDFNALRPQLDRAAVRDQLADIAVRAAATVLPAVAKAMPRLQELAQSVSGMNKRSVVSAILERGYRDADDQQRPTAPAAFPAFGIDYVFCNNLVAVDDFAVVNTPQVRRASDHLPITYTAIA